MANDPQSIVEDATFDYTMGDTAVALEKLNALVKTHPDCFAAWHALTEIHYSQRAFSEALEAAQTAHTIDPQDIHINTSLSRIHMELGDKDTAEHFGAKARTLGWKEQLKEPEGGDGMEIG